MTQSKQTKRRFSPEFKLEDVEQVVKHQQRAVDVAGLWMWMPPCCANGYGSINRSFRDKRRLALP